MCKSLDDVISGSWFLYTSSFDFRNSLQDFTPSESSFGVRIIWANCCLLDVLSVFEANLVVAENWFCDSLYELDAVARSY